MASQEGPTPLELNNLLADIALDAFKEVIPVVRFGRMRKSMRKIVTSRSVTIWSVYYWLRFANFGRGNVKARPDGPPLVFFKDPKDDPRIKQDYPRKRKQHIRLTRRQFKRYLAQGKLIVTRKVGPATAMRFLEHGLQLARKRLPPELAERIRGDVRRLLRRAPDKVTARL